MGGGSACDAPVDISCFNSVWTQQIQGRPLSQTLANLNLFSSRNLRNQPLCHPWTLESVNTIFVFVFLRFCSLLLVNHELPDWSELFHWDESCGQPLGHPASGTPYTYLLWASVSTAKMWLWRAWTTSSMSPLWKRARVHSVSWKSKTSTVSRAVF